MSENADEILLIPEGEAGVCVRVQNWRHRRRVVVARGSEGWDSPDEELSDSEWELPSHVPLIRFGAVGVQACSCECASCHTPTYY